MVKDVEYHLTFDEAKAMVLDALKPLGEPYCEVLRRAFDEHWIDVYENKGKTTGAFSLRRIRRASVCAFKLPGKAQRRVYARPRVGACDAFLSELKKNSRTMIMNTASLRRRSHPRSTRCSCKGIF